MTGIAGVSGTSGISGTPAPCRPDNAPPYAPSGVVCRAPVSEAMLHAQPLLPQPRAVVFTSQLPEANAPFHLLHERAAETVFLTTVAASESKTAQDLRDLGCLVLAAESLAQGLETLRRELGCYRILCEGGGHLGLTLLQNRLANEFELHLAPMILGDNEATPLFTGKSPHSLQEALHLNLYKSAFLEPDLILLLR